MPLANVPFIRPELAKVLPLYFAIRDCLAGSQAIKAARQLYLPIPNAADTSEENRARYEAYLVRAVFYNVTRRTLAGYVGQIFSRDVVVEIPTALQMVVDDANGEGVSLEQQAMRSCGYAAAYSRCGLFVDYPTKEAGSTQKELDDGEARPNIYQFAPWQIINWRKKKVGAKEVYTLIVICETFSVEDDGFEMKLAGQFRVLKLDEAGNYIQEIWREKWPNKYDGLKPLRGSFTEKKTISIKGHDGEPLKEIPFTFIGSENNDSAVDNPNLYDMADLNIAHYRNSADYEESCFIVGQPTPVATGLTEHWVKEVLGGKLNFGSRGGIPLPAGSTFELAQAEENTMIKEAMDTKERQMIALGAKLVQVKEVQRTATESKIDAASESSVLATVARNVSAAYTWALEWCARFQGIPETGIQYKLNDDFDLSNYSPEQIKMVVENWTKGALSFTEMRDSLRKSGLATEDDAKALADITKAQQAAATFEASLIEPPASAA